MSLVSFAEYFSGEAAKEVITAIGVFDEVMEGIGEGISQATEDRAAMEGIDGMAQDEDDAG